MSLAAQAALLPLALQRDAMGENAVVNRTAKDIMRLLRSEDGPTATEYAVLIGVICVAVIGSLTFFGTHMGNIYTIINSALSVF